ncbi:MAG: GNAT family N-acetyltransferase [Deltaproteobacteria bacterium]|nr:GNAT family N-acetyltransferase [Deltaproteobacteria bacterium]
MEVISGQHIQDSLWQDFIRRHKCLAHDLRWREVLQTAYGLQPYYLAMQDGGELAGALPLVRVPGIFTPAQLISLPLLNYAGVAAVSPVIEAALEQAAVRMARRVKAGSVVLRNRATQPADPKNPGQGYFQMIKRLPADEHALWDGLRSEKRTATRKARRAGVKIVRDRNLLPVFIKLYQVAMHEFGTPPHSARWFKSILQAFGGDAEIMVAFRQGTPLAAKLLLMWGDACYNLWHVSLAESKKYSPNNAIYWEAMRLALERGKTEFNFGRSIKGGGTYTFKKHYGALPYPLRYERLSIDGSRQILAPMGSGTAARVWRKIPLALANALGPIMLGHVLPGFGARSL